MTESVMVGRHHRLNGHEFEQNLGDSGGQRSLVDYSLRGPRVGHNLVTENNLANMLNYVFAWTLRFWNMA